MGIIGIKGIVNFFEENPINLLILYIPIQIFVLSTWVYKIVLYLGWEAGHS